MRNVPAVLATGFVLALAAACSEVSGIELLVVEEVPVNIESTIAKSAVSSGLVSTDVRNPMAVKTPGVHFFELPRTDPGNPLSIETSRDQAGMHIRIGRSIYAAYSPVEKAAASRFVATLRDNGIALRKSWSRKLELAPDVESWLRGNRKQ